jgi:hypothetical protein
MVSMITTRPPRVTQITVRTTYTKNLLLSGKLLWRSCRAFLWLNSERFWWQCSAFGRIIQFLKCCVCLDRPSKTTKNLSQDSWSVDQDLSPGSPEYKARVLTTRPQRSVTFFLVHSHYISFAVMFPCLCWSIHIRKMSPCESSRRICRQCPYGSYWQGIRGSGPSILLTQYACKTVNECTCQCISWISQTNWKQ